MKRNHQDGIDWEKGTLRGLVQAFPDFAGSAAVLMNRDASETRLTYEDLADRVARVTGGLSAHGLGPGKRVAIAAPNGPEWVIVCLATINAGAQIIPLDMQLDRDSLSHVLADSRPDLIFATSEIAQRISETSEGELAMALLDATDEEDEQDWRRFLGEAPEQLPPLQPDDVAAIFYTSGTTGPPKGVPLTHRNLTFELSRLHELELMAAGERLLLPLPLHHVYPFVVGFLGALCHGVGIVFPESTTGPQILEAIRRYDVATVIGVPRFYEALLSAIDRQTESRGRIAGFIFRVAQKVCIATKRTTGMNLGRILFQPLHRKFGPDLRLLASGGAALDPGLAWRMEGLGWTVATGYGLTETSPMISMLRPGERRFETVGRPLAGVDLRISPLKAEEGDEKEDAPSAAGVPIGEIQVRGPNVFREYLNLPDRTAEAFTRDGWYRTEDRGSLDDGYLSVFGRASTFVVTPAGENIALEELEKAYEKHPQIKEMGVFLREGKLLAVAVPERSVLRDKAPESVEDAMREAVGSRGREMVTYKRLLDIVVSRSSLERTRLGKIRRNKLVKRFDDIREGGEGAKGPTGPLPIEQMSGEDQALLENPRSRAVWDLLSKRFRQIPLSPDSDIALDLGIDSLEWIDLTLEIVDSAGVSLSEEATGRAETVRDLLQEVVEHSEKAGASIADFARDPGKFITEHQRRWLKPLNPVESFLAWVLYWLNRLAMRALFRLRVSGLEHLRVDGPIVITPNHLSVLDPFVVAAAMPYPLMRRTSFAGWTGMAFANPLYRFVARLARTLPVEHGQAAFSSLALPLEMLKRGQNVVWFPEGGRSLDGELQRFQPGTGILLERSACSAVPTVIRGTFEAMPFGRRLPRLHRIEIEFAAPHRPEALADSGDGAERRDRITTGLQRAVAAVLARRG